MTFPLLADAFCCKKLPKSDPWLVVLCLLHQVSGERGCGCVKPPRKYTQRPSRTGSRESSSYELNGGSTSQQVAPHLEAPNSFTSSHKLTLAESTHERWLKPMLQTKVTEKVSLHRIHRSASIRSIGSLCCSLLRQLKDARLRIGKTFS